MPRDKQAYLNRINKTGNRPTTQNQEVIVETLVDLLDVMDAILVKLEEVKTAIENI